MLFRAGIYHFTENMAPQCLVLYGIIMVEQLILYKVNVLFYYKKHATQLMF